MDEALRAFLGVDFDWTRTLTGVWQDPPHDVPDVHAAELRGVLESFERLAHDEEAPNPLGEVLVGPAGAGKTHFLGTLRRAVIDRGGTFLLADLTDVRDFWETALQGAVTSLTRQLPRGGTQLERILDALLARFGTGALAGLTAAQLGAIRPPALSNRVEALVRSIAQGSDRFQTARHEAVLKALALLGSREQELLGIGEAWLSGLDVREEAKLVWDLPVQEHRPKDRLAGLAWAARFRGPTVIAVDQLDAITSEARAATGIDPGGPGHIFAQTTTGLMGLRDVLPRALVVVTCLDANWGYLEQTALNSVTDRFRPQRFLPAQPGDVLEKLLARRLAVGYARARFTPPHPTYPFRPECFDGLRLHPRELLRRAERHRLRLRALGRIEEISSLEDQTVEVGGPKDGQADLDARFDALCARVDPAAKLRGADPELDKLLEAACRALAREQAPSAGGANGGDLDVEVDRDFGSAGQSEPLHARIRVIDRADGDRERHLSLRFVQQGNPIAFQTRLKKALTESGVGEGLEFRRLIVFRSFPIPSGPKTRQMVEALRGPQASLHHPSEALIRTLAALLRWFEAPPDGFDAWLTARRPVSQLAPFSEHLDFLFGQAGSTPAASARPASGEPAVRGATGGPDASSGPGAGGARADDGGASPLHGAGLPSAPAVAPPDRIALGREQIGMGEGPPREVELGELSKHAAILGAAGSGKTVLLRRLVEEAAVRGVPALVLDVANDLARLGEPWPTAPDGFGPEDAALAARYFETTETVVWTPGWASGNPLSADPLPDFAPLLDAPDELRQALELALAILAPDVGLAKESATTRVRRAILSQALEVYARQGGRGLEDLLRVLDEPGDLATQFSRGGREVTRLADDLRAAMQTNPLLAGEGRRLDFDVLFGRGADRTRVSVVNLSGLPSLEAQQGFVARVMTLLFAYAKQNPGPAGGLAGLVVVDEAKDFAPSQGAVASSAPLRRAAAQLRKYGYGLVVATQEPKSIDHRIVSNSGTQVFGRALSTAAQRAMRDMMAQLGGVPGKVGTLPPGTFFASVPSDSRPAKIRSPWCSSHHGATPTPEDIRAKAAADRARLGT